MASPFDSPKSLIKHAREDLLDLIAICKKAFAGGGYDHIIDRDSDTGHKRNKIKFTGSIPSRAGYVGSNILNNLRHALDQALIASVANLTGHRGGIIYFPFATSPIDLKGRLNSDAYNSSRQFAPYFVLVPTLSNRDRLYRRE